MKNNNLLLILLLIILFMLLCGCAQKEATQQGIDGTPISTNGLDFQKHEYSETMFSEDPEDKIFFVE